jgi:hypothetical protein
MPLITNAKDILRANLELLAQGERPMVVTIGYLTEKQHTTINIYRMGHDLPRLASPEVVFLGRHLYNSRVIKDGYTIDDILDQIESAMSDTAIAIATHKMTALRSTTVRSDRYGNQVTDEAVLELTQRRPKSELYSVIPKGDRKKPAGP